MAPLSQFRPLLRETVNTVRARFDSDANAGLVPEDLLWKDITPGGFYWDITQLSALEAERLWDFLSIEVPAACFPAFAWGSYLDEHAATVGLARKASTKGAGQVTFEGTVGALIATGTELATERTDPDAEPVIFRTMESLILAPAPGPEALVGTAVPGGALLGDTYYYYVTAVTDDGESIISNEISVTVAPLAATPTTAVALTWNGVAGATSYNIYRGTQTNEEVLLVELGEVLTYTDNGSATGTDQRPPTNTVDVQAAENGTRGNVPAGAISFLLSPVIGISSLENIDATTGGFDVESDTLLRRRVWAAYQTPHGGGTIADYVRWALAYPEVGYVLVEPVWNGPGTVRLVVTDQENNPVTPLVSEGLQMQLDPVVQEGRGLAPIGANVTVTTPVIVPVVIHATLTMLDGYTIEGAGGTTAVRGGVTEAVAEYVNQLGPGQDVIKERIAAQILSVTGVYDVALATPAANIPISSLEVAQLTEPLTLGSAPLVP